MRCQTTYGPVIDEKMKEVTQNTQEPTVAGIAGNRQLMQTNSLIKAILDKSKNIDDTNKVVDDIAERTNLLTVNVAIEALIAVAMWGEGIVVLDDQATGVEKAIYEQHKSMEILGTSLLHIRVSAGDVQKEAEAIKQDTQGIVTEMWHLIHLDDEVFSLVKRITADEQKSMTFVHNTLELSRENKENSYVVIESIKQFKLVQP
jgi:hypothetical protein